MGAAIAIAALPASAGVTTGEQLGGITEFSAGISAGARPDRIISSGGRLYFTDADSPRISASTPAGTITEFRGALSDPAHAIAAAGNGEVWALGASGKVAVVRPDGTPATTLDLESAGPHDLVSMSNGDVLLTVDAGTRRYDQSTHGLTGEHAAPTSAACIARTATGFVYSDTLGSLRFTNAEGVTDDSKTVTGVEPYNRVPCHHTFAEGPDGSIWSLTGNPPSGHRGIRRTDPAAKTHTDFTAGLTADAGLSSIAAGPDGAMWFTERDANKIGRITSDGTITEYPLPSAGSGPSDIVAGPDGAMWFTERDGARIGRIDVQTAAPATPAVPTSPTNPMPTGQAPAAPPPPPGPLAAITGASSLLVSHQSPRSRNGLVPFAVTCLSVTRCDGTITLTATIGGSRRRIAKVKAFSIKPGAIKLNVRLTGDARKRAKRGLKATARIVVGKDIQTVTFTLKGT